MRLLLNALVASTVLAQNWTPQTSNTTASLRGVSAVNQKVVYASGSGGAWMVTRDGGATWRAAKVPGAEQLDFRAIQAVDEHTVYLLSIGNGDKSRLYKTGDGGEHWDLLLTNPDAKGFLDELAFWDALHGIILGDPVDGEFAIFTTADGGRHWIRQHAPPSVAGEGAFAASNSSLAVMGSADAWFGTGGPGGARVFHSRDAGKTWTVAPTPIRNDAAASGIFSLAFADARHGAAVGGDYSKAGEDLKNLAITSDGGLTWSEPAGRPKGFRSAVAWLEATQAWLVTGTSGSDISTDGGNTWKNFDSGNYNALSIAAGKAAWAVGPRGRIAVLVP
jgi:photosystem II stability/assembly factor-like uncharacterized protein